MGCNGHRRFCCLGAAKSNLSVSELHRGIQGDASVHHQSLRHSILGVLRFCIETAKIIICVRGLSSVEAWFFKHLLSLISNLPIVGWVAKILVEPVTRLWSIIL